jgi:regulatory protein
MAEVNAFETALAAVERKERTAHEVASLLERRGFVPAEIETAMRRLSEAGVVDDERFARRYSDDKRELSGWGAERIRDALLARGVEGSIVDAVLAADTHDDQIDRAREIVIRRGRPLDANRDRQRALGYLTRRGYDSEIAYEAVRQAAARRAA